MNDFDDSKAHELNISVHLHWAIIRNAINIALLLSAIWYFFMYGQNDLALNDSMEIVNSLVNILPISLIPLVLFIIYKFDRSKNILIFNILLILAFGIFFTQSLVIWINPLFGSRWTWAYTDIRELNYLNPSFKILTYLVLILLVLIDNNTITKYITQIHKNYPNEGKIIQTRYTIIVSFAFSIWGIFQYIFSTQPILVTSIILMNIIFVEILINILISIKIWKKDRNNLSFVEENKEEMVYQPKIKFRIFQFLCIFGFFILSFLTWFYPIQLGYQEGPSNPWGSSLIISTAVTIAIIFLWKKYNIVGIKGFLYVILVSLIAPAVISIGWKIIPGSVENGLYFASMGFVLLFFWIIYNDNSGEIKASKSLQQWFLWIWFFIALLLTNDPLFEIWEMEEGLRKLIGRDLYGTGIGLYYEIIAQVWLFILIGGILVTILVKWNKNRTDHKSIMTFIQEISKPRNTKAFEERTNQRLKSQITAIFIIGLVIGSSGVILTGIALQKSNPTIVARIGNHGVLWQANIYDRVLPNYHPNFASSPSNATIELFALRGETESIQLVFSPLASKMISFQYYQWSHNASFSKSDNLWEGPNGNTANISISAGKIGYLSCFDTNIADVILPWSAFITGNRDNVPFWLDVSVPYGISPGIYTTHFQFVTTTYLQRSIQGASLEFELKLNVWNITKPLNRSLETCINYFPENPAITEKLIDLGIQYGIDPYGTATEAIWGKTEDMVSYNATNLSEGLTINWTYFDERVEKMFEKGMSQIKIDFYPGIDCRHYGEAVLNGSKDNYLTIISWFYGNASEHLKSKYTPWGTTWESETITQHSDEPDWRISPFAIDAFRKLYLMMDKITEIKTLQTFMYEPEFDPWLDCLDIWVLTPDSYSVDVAQKIIAAGREVWTYSNGDNFPGGDTDLRTPLIMSRLRGWVDFKYNITGFLDWVFYWNFNDAGQSGSGYDGRGDGTEIVPFYGSYAPTLRLVAFRDGLEDNELLVQLRKMIEKARVLNQMESEEYQAAINIMQKIDSALSKQPADNKWALPVVTREFNHTPSLYLNLRIEAGNSLTNLISILG